MSSGIVDGGSSWIKKGKYKYHLPNITSRIAISTQVDVELNFEFMLTYRKGLRMSGVFHMYYTKPPPTKHYLSLFVKWMAINISKHRFSLIAHGTSARRIERILLHHFNFLSPLLTQNYL